MLTLTNGLPDGWGAAAEAAASRWNQTGRSLNLVVAPSRTAAFAPHGCSAEQRRVNGLHVGDVDGRGDAVAITHTCVRPETREAVSFQIVLDVAESWSTGAEPPAPHEYDLLGVLVHELGHGTFWDGHFPRDDEGCNLEEPTEVMCPHALPGRDTWRELGARDEAVFSQVY